MNITIRASALHRALKCPASALDPGDRVDPHNPAAALGTAVHEALVPLVESGGVRWDDLPVLAARHGVEEDDVRALAGMASRMWTEGRLGADHPGACAEMPMAAGLVRGGAVDLTGTADVLARRSGQGEEPAVGAVLDWKTGRVDADHGDQLAAYAYLAAMTCGFDEVRATVAWVRDGEVETRVWARADLVRWAEDAAATLAGWDGRTRSPGAHCAHCPIAHRCDARTALARADVAALLGEALDVAALTPAQAIALHGRARDVARICEGALDALRTRVAESGDIEGDGVRLTIQVSQARKADTLAAWPLIEGLGLTDEALCGTLDVSLPRLEKAVAAAAGRGSGKAAIEALGAALAAAGAITTTERRALVTRRM